MRKLVAQVRRERRILARRRMGESAVRGCGPLIIAVAALGSVMAGPTIWALIAILTIAGLLLILSVVGAPLGAAFL